MELIRPEHQQYFIELGASGKIATGSDIVKRLAQGADHCNAGRAMMMATGCIQSQCCHTNECPVGVATQDPRRARGLDVPDKTERVHRYQTATVTEALPLAATPEHWRDDWARASPDTFAAA
ncbi:MAG: hypothetical protein QOF76_4743 [Solirubrobacteraceae bacterium]|nr:hypothetical protein [Solirubrobacteraceae bacterium]